MQVRTASVAFVVFALGAAALRADEAVVPAPAPAADAKADEAAEQPRLGLPSDLPPPTVLPRSGRFAEIFFLRESSQILLPGKQSLDAAARLLVAKPEVNVLIDGNADATGEHLYNRVLSSWRALAVKKYLVQRGVADARISIRASSTDRPVSSNDTSVGRRQNRRVDLLIGDPDAPVPQIAAAQQ